MAIPTNMAFGNVRANETAVITDGNSESAAVAMQNFTAVAVQPDSNWGTANLIVLGSLGGTAGTFGTIIDTAGNALSRTNVIGGQVVALPAADMYGFGAIKIKRGSAFSGTDGTITITARNI